MLLSLFLALFLSPLSSLLSPLSSLLSPLSLSQNQETPAVVTRAYELDFPLKYGCNPHQLPSNIYRMAGGKLPFKVSSSSSNLNSKP